MPVTPDTLRPAAAHLYRQFEHLEVGDADTGVTAADQGWPVATVCAALAAPIERLWELLALPEHPWQPAFDLENAPGWVLPWVANFAGIELSAGLAEEQMRDRLLRADARSRGTITAMVQAIFETLTGDRRAIIVRERDGSAYHLTVRTYAAETPDSAVTEARARAAKAGGLTLDFDVIPGQDWRQVVDDYATWADVLADYPTWADVVADTPAP